MSEILPELRVATRDAHQHLEDAVQIERRIVDPVAYLRLLAIFLGFYRPLEHRLATLPGWPENGIDFDARRKTPWLEADLLNLGSGAVDAGRLPSCDHLPTIHSLPGGFGCLYVLEGATLGGRQITALMQTSQIPSSARHFFASYGVETGARWREFVAALEAFAGAADFAARAAIVRGAQETFACLQDWFVRDCHRDEYHGSTPRGGS